MFVLLKIYKILQLLLTLRPLSYILTFLVKSYVNFIELFFNAIVKINDFVFFTIVTIAKLFSIDIYSSDSLNFVYITGINISAFLYGLRNLLTNPVGPPILIIIILLEIVMGFLYLFLLFIMVFYWVRRVLSYKNNDSEYELKPISALRLEASPEFYILMGFKHPNMDSEKLGNKIEEYGIDIFYECELSEWETSKLSFSAEKSSLRYVFTKMLRERTFLRAYYKAYALVYRILKYSVKIINKEVGVRSRSYKFLKFFIYLVFFIFKNITGFAINLVIHVVNFSDAFSSSFMFRGRNQKTKVNRFKSSLVSALTSHSSQDLSKKIYKNEKTD